MNANESFERWGTMAFGHELMSILIRPFEPGPCLACGSPVCVSESTSGVKAKAGDMDARAWFLLVPARYQAEVRRIVAEASRPFVGFRMGSWMTKVYVAALHAAICSELKPVIPAACTGYEAERVADGKGKVWQ